MDELLEEFLGPLGHAFAAYVQGLTMQIDGQKIIIRWRGKVKEYTFEEFNRKFGV